MGIVIHLMNIVFILQIPLMVYLSLQVVDFLAKIIKHIFATEELAEEVAKSGSHGCQKATKQET